MDSQTKGHVAVGAIVSFVFLPYSGVPLLGGALAGYLEGADLRSGAAVGVMAGFLALAVVLAFSVVDILLGVSSFGLTEILYDGIYWPIRRAIVPLVVLPLIGGGIGAHVRRETHE